MVEAKGKIKRGKYDFVIIPILPNRLNALEFTIWEKSCQTIKPDKKKMGYGILSVGTFTRIPKTK